MNEDTQHGEAVKQYALYGLAKLLTGAIRFYRWRAECPSCGRQRHNLSSPYGWTCDNPDCNSQRMPEIQK